MKKLKVRDMFALERIINNHTDMIFDNRQNKALSHNTRWFTYYMNHARNQKNNGYFGVFRRCKKYYFDKANTRNERLK